MKLCYCDKLDYVWFVTKTKQDNGMTDLISLIYSKTETKLSEPVQPDAVYDENKIGQWHDQCYKCILHWKRY